MSGYYYIKTYLKPLVLEVANESPNPGMQVYSNPKNNGPNQQWRDDHATGTIRVKLDDFCMDIEGGQLVINPYEPGKQDQQWERKGNTITNRSDKMVLEIAGDDPGDKVTKAQGNGGTNQSWAFEKAA